MMAIDAMSFSLDIQMTIHQPNSPTLSRQPATSFLTTRAITGNGYSFTRTSILFICSTLTREKLPTLISKTRPSRQLLAPRMPLLLDRLLLQLLLLLPLPLVLRLWLLLLPASPLQLPLPPLLQLRPQLFLLLVHLQLLRPQVQHQVLLL